MTAKMIRRFFNTDTGDRRMNADKKEAVSRTTSERKDNERGVTGVTREIKEGNRSVTPSGQKYRKMKGYSACSCLAAATVMMVATVPVYAAGADTVTSGFNTLFDIVSALVSAIGSIILLWGFFEWGTALQSQDGVMQSNAFKRIGGGLIMVLAPQLITAFITV